MQLKSCGLSVALLLGLSVAANASRVVGSSSYGDNNSSSPQTCTSSTTTSFTGFTFSCDDTGTADITAEAFVSSNPSNDLLIYDFEVTNAPSDYTLALTATGDPISVNDIGLFYSPSCTSSTSPQCSNELPMGVTSTTTDYGSVSGNTVYFPVSGASSSDSFVFFVALEDPEGGTPANVTASFVSPSSVPEPSFVVFACLGLLGVIGVVRRRHLVRQES